MSACWHTQPSSFTAWSLEGLDAARWRLEPSSFTGWNLDRSGLGEIVRLTEDGFVRVTEQTIVRIIERMPTMWTSEATPPFNNWVTEIQPDAFEDTAFDPCAFE
jgi:hypothetical protein